MGFHRDERDNTKRGRGPAPAPARSEQVGVAVSATAETKLRTAPAAVALKANRITEIIDAAAGGATGVAQVVSRARRVRRCAVVAFRFSGVSHESLRGTRGRVQVSLIETRWSTSSIEALESISIDFIGKNRNDLLWGRSFHGLGKGVLR